MPTVKSGFVGTRKLDVTRKIYHADRLGAG